MHRGASGIQRRPGLLSKSLLTSSPATKKERQNSTKRSSYDAAMLLGCFAPALLLAVDRCHSRQVIGRVELVLPRQRHPRDTTNRARMDRTHVDDSEAVLLPTQKQVLQNPPTVR